MKTPYRILPETQVPAKTSEGNSQSKNTLGCHLSRQTESESVINEEMNASLQEYAVASFGKYQL